jgi:nicotinate-nucleotide adenylyltransferase
MVELAIASNPHFAVSRVDIDRFGPCYTVDTIELLRDEWGPGVEIYFIMGADSLLDILTWHNPRRLIRLCRFAVVSRPGYQVDLDELDTLLPGVASRVQMLNAPELAMTFNDGCVRGCPSSIRCQKQWRITSMSINCTRIDKKPTNVIQCNSDLK